jgi:hypothetical protein
MILKYITTTYSTIFLKLSIIIHVVIIDDVVMNHNDLKTTQKTLTIINLLFILMMHMYSQYQSFLHWEHI